MIAPQRVINAQHFSRIFSKRPRQDSAPRFRVKNLNSPQLQCSARFGICKRLLTGLEMGKMVSRLPTYFIFLHSQVPLLLLLLVLSSFSFMRINECYLHSAMQREKGHSREKRGGERGGLCRGSVAPSLCFPSAGEIEERTNINIKSVCKNVFNFRLCPHSHRRHRL